MILWDIQIGLKQGYELVDLLGLIFLFWQQEYL